MLSKYESALITGVSSGIGHGLAKACLDRGIKVFGISRREPGDLLRSEDFAFRRQDLREHTKTAETIDSLLPGVQRLDLVVLNAGVLGPIADMAETNLSVIKDTFEINVWANKVLLDELFLRGIAVAQVISISSGASYKGSRGWGAYSLSKASLNMLTKLYAAENATTHFCSLAPGTIDTAMQDIQCAVPKDKRYPYLEALKAKRNTAEMPHPHEVAGRLLDIFEELPSLVESGGFLDVRELPANSVNAR